MAPLWILRSSLPENNTNLSCSNDLLFRASSDSLILIDEPELSLHVAWQAQWVTDLEETAKLSRLPRNRRDAFPRDHRRQMGFHRGAARTERPMKGRSAIIIANDIRLKRHVHKGCFLLVEGRDDRLLFRQFSEHSICWIMTVNGKQNVIDVVNILEGDPFPGIAGVVDADFDHVEDRPLSSDNLIMLETVDLEALLVRSSALDRVLVELGSLEKIAEFGRDVRGALVEAAVPIGCLRLHSLRTELGLRFQGLKYGRFIDKDSLAIDIRALVEEVKHRSQRSDLPSEDVVRQVSPFVVRWTIIG